MDLGSQALIGLNRSPARREKCSWEAQPWMWVEIITCDIPSQRRWVSRITTRNRVGSVLANPGQGHVNGIF